MRNIISPLAENRIDNVGIFIVVLAGKFLFAVTFYSGSLKDFWPAAGCSHEYPPQQF